MPRLLWILFLIETSARNLLRAPRRTLISLLAIAAATGAMIVFQSFVDGVKSTFRENVITSTFGHYQIFKKGYRDNDGDEPFAYQIANIDTLRQDIEQQVGGLKIASKRQPFYGLLSFNDRSLGGLGFGVDAAEERSFLTLYQVVSGKHLADGGEHSIFIGYKLANRLKLKEGDTVTILLTTSTGSMNAMDLEVIGTFKSGVTQLDEGSYMVHHATATNLLKTEGAPIILLGFDTQNELPYGEKLTKLLAEKYPDLEAVHWIVLADFFENTMGWVEKMVDVFRVIILAIATLSIVTVFMMGLFERIGEFGTMRAIGTHRASITLMIFVESLMQSTLGSLIGLALGIVMIELGLHQGIIMPPPPLMSVPFHVLFHIPWDSIPSH
jgi:putative ABC transport system permease protein